MAEHLIYPTISRTFCPARFPAEAIQVVTAAHGMITCSADLATAMSNVNGTRKSWMTVSTDSFNNCSGKGASMAERNCFTLAMRRNFGLRRSTHEDAYSGGAGKLKSARCRTTTIATVLAVSRLSLAGEMEAHFKRGEFEGERVHALKSIAAEDIEKES